MPQITISFPNVLVDGTSYGKVADTIANNPKLAPDIQRALEAWNDSLSAAQRAAIKTEQDKTTALQSEFVAYKSRAEQLIAAAQANMDDHDALKAVVAEAVKPEKDRQREALLAQQAAIEAQLAAL